ncbi:MAG: AEC family transporter, partial [Verrucomicrobiota bacterium]
MQISYWPLLAAVAPVFLIILAGFIIRRVGWLTREADHSLLRVCVNVLMPCLILDSILGNPALSKIENVTLPPLIGFSTFLIGYLVALPVGRLIRLTETQARTFSFTVGSYNYAYIPIPLVLAFCPRETTGVLFTHNLGVEIAFWTAGIGILTGSSLRNAWTKIFNPPVLAIVGSLLL